MADPFSNEPIPTDHLPRLTDDAFVPVDPRYLRVKLAGVALTATIVAIGTVLIAMQAVQKIQPLLIGGGLLLLLMLVAVVRVLQVRRLAYQVREHDLSLRSGVITHRVASLPFSRVQHVNVQRGPIERSLGLATLRVSTAGPDISLPGLARADAERIKLLVTERAHAIDDADADADDDAGLGDMVDDAALGDTSTSGGTLDDLRRSPRTGTEILLPPDARTAHRADFTSLPPPPAPG